MNFNKKNKLNKFILIGLISTLSTSLIYVNSFAANKEDMCLVNLVTANNEGISPQMIAVIASLATSSGITLSENNDIYDICGMFIDYVNNSVDGGFEGFQANFLKNSSVLNNKYININSSLLDIFKGFFDKSFSSAGVISGTKYGVPHLGVMSSSDFPGQTNYVRSNIKGYKFTGTKGDKVHIGNLTFECLSGGNRYDIYQNGVNIGYITLKYGFHHTYYFVTAQVTEWYGGFWGPMYYCTSETNLHMNDIVLLENKTLDFSYEIDYSGDYDWGNIDAKKETDNSLALPVPRDLSTLVGQSSTEFWDDAKDLINPCAQEITLPKVDNPSISIGESIRLQVQGADCSIYNAEELVQKAEGSKEVDDIDNARNEVNKLPESQDKNDLQDRLDAIFPNLSFSTGKVSANLDVYIKSENMLSLSLDTNSVSFEGYSGVADMEKLGAVNITVNSSLPYNLNAYMPTEILSSDGNNKMPIDILNIRESNEGVYKQFENTDDKIILKENCQKGNNINHSIDLKLDSNNAHKADIYKTVIKFEAVQK